MIETHLLLSLKGSKEQNLLILPLRSLICDVASLPLLFQCTQGRKYELCGLSYSANSCLCFPEEANSSQKL